MKAEDYQRAITIISESNSPKVSFNVPVKSNYSNVYNILIHESNADLINKLKEAEFSMSMTPKGLSVSKY